MEKQWKSLHNIVHKYWIKWFDIHKVFPLTSLQAVSIKFIKAAVRFKSITCSNYLPVKVWIDALGFGYITEEEEEKILMT